MVIGRKTILGKIAETVKTRYSSILKSKAFFVLRKVFINIFIKECRFLIEIIVW